jgi:histidinol dehydrogenase
VALERLACSVADAAGAAARVRALVPTAASVAPAVREILGAVRTGGDAAVADYERRFGGTGAPLRVEPAELQAALAALDPEVRTGLELAIANVAAVAAAGVGEDVEVRLEQGQTVRVRELPVRRAAVYAPGGRSPYPSSVVMGAVTARAAGVEEVAVAAPEHPVMLAACALCEVDAVYRMGGAQAIAALAYGTETVPPADVIVGPGNLYVQEAKRQVSGGVGIDGFAGPSDLVVVASAGAAAEPLALDLDAQAEHGEDSLVVAVSDDAGLLEEIAAALEARDTPALKAVVAAADMEAALAFAEALAPEHLQLAGAAAEALAPRVRSAGCLFVGEASGTAFGDYVAGSNHTLPTQGAARFASGLSARHFRRRMAEVRIGPAAGALAGPGAAIARAEGFPLHAASMQIRENRRR